MAAPGLIFLSSPFSVAAVELLRDLACPPGRWARARFSTSTILEAMAGNGAPVLLSTGMSSWEHMTWAVDQVRGLGLDVALFQCTSRYPSALEEVGLNVLPEIRARFGCPAGLSDHSGSVFPGLAALAQGADLLEVHLTLTRRAFGPDIPVSLTVEELALLCHARDSFHTMRTHPVDKDAAAEAMSAMRGIFSKSLAPSRPLAAGTVLTPDMLCPKKPGTGIPVSALQDVVGKTLQRDVTPERLLRPEDFA
jgi:N-acetylneuraminate synthase